MSEMTQHILPYLFYEDVEAALDWMAKAFGLRVREAEVMRNDAGTVVHAAMELASGEVVLFGMPEAYQSPRRHGHVNGLLYVYVEDVDAHRDRAHAAGATLVSDLEDVFYGDRRYAATDCEGHHWTFAQKLRDVPPEEWEPGEGDLEGHG